MAKTKQKAPVSLRLPDDLQQHLAQQARAGYRSLTQEIVMRLEQSRERQAAPLNTVAPQGGNAGDCVS